MRRNSAALALCALMAACTGADENVVQPVAATAVAATAPAAEPAKVTQTPVGGIASPASAAEARGLVVDYYDAINARDYRKAYSMWSRDGAASRQSFADFSGGYAGTGSVQAEVGAAVDEQGAAGSRFIEVPVELRAQQHDGSQRTYRGRYILRAVTADGASERQRRWHLDSAELQRLP